MSTSCQKKPKMISTIPSHRPNSPTRTIPTQRWRRNGIKSPDPSPRSPRSASDVVQHQQSSRQFTRQSYLARFEAQNQTKLQQRVAKPVIRQKSSVTNSPAVVVSSSSSSKKISSTTGPTGNNNNNKKREIAAAMAKNKGQGEKVGVVKKSGTKLNKISCIPKPSSSTLIKATPSSNQQSSCKIPSVVALTKNAVEQKNSQKSINSPQISMSGEISSAEIRSSSSSSQMSPPQIEVSAVASASAVQKEGHIEQDGPNSEFDPHSLGPWRMEGEFLFYVQSTSSPLDEKVNEVIPPTASQAKVSNSDAPSSQVDDDSSTIVVKEQIPGTSSTTMTVTTTPSKLQMEVPEFVQKLTEKSQTDENEKMEVQIKKSVDLTPAAEIEKNLTNRKNFNNPQDVLASIEDQMNNNYIYISTNDDDDIDITINEMEETKLVKKCESHDQKLGCTTIVGGETREMSPDDVTNNNEKSPAEDVSIIQIEYHPESEVSTINSLHENVQVNITQRDDDIMEFSEAQKIGPDTNNDVQVQEIDQKSEVEVSVSVDKKKKKKGRRDVDEIEEIKNLKKTVKISTAVKNGLDPGHQQQQKGQKRSTKNSASIEKKRSRGKKQPEKQADPLSKTNEEVQKKLKPKIKKNVKLAPNDDNKCQECLDQTKKEWVPLSRKSMTRSRVNEPPPLAPAGPPGVGDSQKNVKEFVSFSKMPLLYETGQKLQGVLRISNISAMPLYFRVSSCSLVEDRYEIEPKDGQLNPNEHTVVRLMTHKGLKEGQVKSDIFKVETLPTTQTGKTSSNVNRRLWMNTPQSKITTSYTKSTLLYQPHNPFFQACLMGNRFSRQMQMDSLAGLDNGDNNNKNVVSINVHEIFKEIQTAQKNILSIRRINCFHNVWMCVLFLVDFAVVWWMAKCYPM